MVEDPLKEAQQKLLDAHQQDPLVENPAEPDTLQLSASLVATSDLADFARMILGVIGSYTTTIDAKQLQSLADIYCEHFDQIFPDAYKDVTPSEMVQILEDRINFKNND